MSAQEQRPKQAQMFAPRPGMHNMSGVVEKAKDFKGTVKRLSAYLKPFYAVLIVIVIFMILRTIFDTAAPKIIGLAITKLFDFVKGKSVAVDTFSYISNVTILLVVLGVVNTVIAYFTQKSLAVISQTVIYNIRKEIDLKFTRLPLKYFDSKQHGDIMSRMTNDADNINNTLSQGLSQFISSMIGIVGALIMMLVISPMLTLIAVIVLPLSFGVTMTIVKKSQNFYKAQQKTLGELNSHVEEMLSGHAVVKAFGYESKSKEYFEKINARLYEAGWKAQFMSVIIFPIMNFISNLGYAAVCVAGGLMVAVGKLALGDIQAFILYIRMFTQPVAQAAGMANMLQSAVASAERIFELLDETEEVQETESVNQGTQNGSVSFENVSFGYSVDKPLFEGLTLIAEQGSTVAIVGPTGAGKTTLVNLLMRFYETWGGQIAVDGLAITDMKRATLRKKFGMVLQDTWLFTGTIKENIAYGFPEATNEAIINAAKAAHAHHFIEALPEGYNTLLKEDASNISQGEKQLLTIARAILADPEMLILDEATSSVDTRTEMLIQNAMNTLMKGRTAFVIAHRLSTIRNAGLILVMDKGKIVETGTHVGMLAKGGFYADLYKAQFSGR